MIKSSQNMVAPRGQRRKFPHVPDGPEKDAALAKLATDEAHLADAQKKADHHFQSGFDELAKLRAGSNAAERGAESEKETEAVEPSEKAADMERRNAEEANAVAEKADLEVKKELEAVEAERHSLDGMADGPEKEAAMAKLFMK